MKQKIIALLLTFITLIPFSNGIVQAAEKATPVKSTYIISSDSSFAPFVFQNESNQYTGIDMDLIKAIAEDQGFTIQINNPGFDVALKRCTIWPSRWHDCWHDRDRHSKRDV